MAERDKVGVRSVPLDLAILKEELVGLEIVDSTIGMNELKFLSENPIGRHLLDLETGDPYRRLAAVKGIGLSQLALVVNGIGGFQELTPYFDWCKAHEYDPVDVSSRDFYIAAKAGLTSGEVLGFAEEVQAWQSRFPGRHSAYRDDPSDEGHGAEHRQAMAERVRDKK